MDKFAIHGGRPLQGEIKVKGAKNAALKLMAASLLTDQAWTIDNVPRIEDIFRLVELIKGVGAEVKEISKGRYQIQAKQIENIHLEPAIAQRLKGSILMAAPLLIRRGQAFLPRPGGCVIGQRPRDIFLDGFQAFGLQIKPTSQGYHLIRRHPLKGAKFVFPLISVTATETMMLMAVLAKGKTFLKNAACEPETVSLANFLNQAGAKIKGAGTPFIEIEGVSRLKGGSCRVMPDRIEAGSLAILGAAAQSPIKITNLNPNDLEVLWFLLKKAGVNLAIDRKSVSLKPPFKLKAVNLKTHEYPGLATDLQAPFTVLMTQAKGLSLVHETIFEGRLFYTDLLNQMGANIIMADPHRVLIQGPTKLSGRHLASPDIRAGIALVMAALIARGQSIIENVYQVDRGYEKIDQRLRKLGADIKRI